MENRILIILGMHRSGTSLVTNWIYLCGLNLGEDLIGKSPYNKNGHYEDRDFHNIHERIFRCNGIPYGGLKQIDNLIVTKEQKEKLKRLIEVKNSKNQQWGWKDPRTNMFLPIYQELIPDANYLILYRDPFCVIESLLRRMKDEFKRLLLKNRFSKIKYFIFQKYYNRKVENSNIHNFALAWIQHNRKILDHLNKVPKEKYRVISYDYLIENSSCIHNWLQENGFVLEKFDFNKVFDPSLMKSVNQSTLKLKDAVIKEIKDIEFLFKEILNKANE